MKFLVFHAESDQVVPADDKPHHFVPIYDLQLMCGKVAVWADPSVSADLVRNAINVFLIRIDSEYPMNELASAVNQIVTRYPLGSHSIVALGASPKMIKWMLKRLGYDTIAISVSKVRATSDSTPEFREYVQGKLSKVKRQNLVVIDFVLEGEGLVRIKQYLMQLWNPGQVIAVALGAGTKFKKDGANAPHIDFIIEGIPELTMKFEANQFKTKMGRSKDMLDYSTYPKMVPKGDVTQRQKDTYARIKPAFARAAELGPLKIDLMDFLDMDSNEKNESKEEEFDENEWEF